MGFWVSEGPVKTGAQCRPNLNRSYNASLPLVETTMLLAPQPYQYRSVPETDEFQLCRVLHLPIAL